MHKIIPGKYFNLYIASTPATGKSSNEDKIQYKEKGKDEFRVVVADGVSTSLMGGEWARILVEKSEDSKLNPLHPDNIKIFELAVKDFNKLIQDKLTNGSRLLSEKIKRDKYGSSTLLVCDINKNLVEGYNIGDTIPLKLTSNKITPFNNSHKKELDQIVPKQVLSKNDFFDNSDKTDTYFTTFSSTNKKSKIFFFATDAVAKFLLPKKKHRNKKFACELIDVIKEDRFDEFIKENRLKSSPEGIQDDDSTIVIIEYNQLDADK